MPGAGDTVFKEFLYQEVRHLQLESVHLVFYLHIDEEKDNCFVMPGSKYSQNSRLIGVRLSKSSILHPLFKKKKPLLGFSLDTSCSNITSFLVFPSLLNKRIFTKRKLDVKLTVI